MGEEEIGTIEGYAYRFDLASGATLKVNLFPDDEWKEQIWQFTYRYDSHPGSRLREERILNDVSLVADYEFGIPTSIGLNMHIVLPNKTGKVFRWGADVSPGSRVNASFEYRKIDDIFVMEAIDLGSYGRQEIPRSREGLVRATDSFPFPLEQNVTQDLGSYLVPFLKNDGELDHFDFPADCRRKLQPLA